MRGLETGAWAVALVALAAGGPAFGQISSTGLGGSTGSGGNIGTASSSNFGGGSGFSTSGTGGTGGTGGMGGTGGRSGSGAGGNGGTTLAQTESAPNIGKPNGSQSSSTSASNFLSGFYGNPNFQGKSFTATNATPGGFGQPLYGNATSGSGRNTGANAFGTGLGGRNTGLSSSNQSGIVVPLPVQLSYTAQMQFPTAPVPAAQLQADIRAVLANSSLAGQNVQVLVTGNNVTLRGAVSDAGDARFAEGMIRTTPGVGTITNELTYPGK
ncbi:MAG: BON domain-containing protein [Gemmataceae bacterium]|nr:BON domain-containing protein [Gemmataceae bacterium]